MKTENTRFWRRKIKYWRRGWVPWRNSDMTRLKEDARNGKR